MSTAEATPAIRPWVWPLYTQEATRVSVPAVLWALREAGGEITDRKGGRAGSKVIDKARELGWPIHPRTTISQMFGELENGRFGRCIYREKGAKRTYLVRLLLTDAEMPPRPKELKVYQAKEAKVVASAPPVEPEPEPTPDPVPTPERPDDPNIAPPKAELTVAPSEPVVEPVGPVLPPLVTLDDPMSLLLQINQLSMKATMALIADVGTVVPPAPDAAERDAEKTRLAQTIEENNRLRRKVNEATETLVAKAKEIEALRRALNVANSNMKALQDAANAAPQREAALRNLKSTQRFMSERPRTGVR